MSAFIVESSHIDALVASIGVKLSYFHNGNWCEKRDRNEIGRILLDENVRSVQYHYGSKGIVVPQPYRFHLPARAYSPVEIISAADGLDYQSCEAPDWKDTEAYAILQTIRESAISKLPGMKDAAWHITDNKNRK